MNLVRYCLSIAIFACSSMTAVNESNEIMAQLAQLQRSKNAEQRNVLYYMQLIADIKALKNNTAAFSHTYAQWQLNNPGFSQQEFRNSLDIRVERYEQQLQEHKMKRAEIERNIDAIEKDLNKPKKESRARSD